VTWVWSIDGWIVAIAMLCAAACALPGAFLVLRRQSMMGDAISHAVLPGLGAGFVLMLWLKSSDWIASASPALGEWLAAADPRHPLAMFLGAVAAGLLTAFLTEWVHAAGKVDRGAAMGVVFTALFAVGLIILGVVTGEHHVDLDPGCVLYGQVELAPGDTWTVGGALVPRAFIILAAAFLINLAFTIAFFKELRITSFDAPLATTLGLNARVMHYALMTVTAVTTVASFETVGSILVIAMLIVPAATARLLTDRLAPMLAASVALGVMAAGAGHALAIASDTQTSGMIAVASGAMFGAAVLFAPRHGALLRALHRARAARAILAEDILGLLYRLDEAGAGEPEAEVRRRVRAAIGASSRAVRRAISALSRDGSITRHDNDRVDLTPSGRERARRLVRSHRLWESYLVEQMGLRPDHVHGTAMRLEHITTDRMSDELAAGAGRPPTDPHGREIPQ